jgi:phenylacetate-CoA ligase
MNRGLLGLYHHLPAPVRSAAATLRGLYLQRWRFGAETERLIAEALARESWTEPQWTAWRDERLAALLEHAATNVPYYRDAWRARRRAGDRASWELLDNWPILEKASFRATPRAFLADGRRKRDVLYEPTSGTTGTPLAIAKDRDALRHLYALATARSRRWYGVYTGDRIARLGGQLVTPLGQRRPPFWVWNAAGRELYMSTFHLAPELIPHYLDALVKYRIGCLTGYASSLYALALGVLRSGRVELRLKAAVTTAEPVEEEQRAVIAAAFACPVRETYGMTENVAAASECEAGRLHQWPEVGKIEVRDDEFICTGLLNDAMPLIRYRIGDRGRLAAANGRCACGRTLPVISAIEGRSSDLLITPDGRRVFWLNPVFYGLPVRQGQIVQETVDRVRIRIVPAPDFTEAAGRTLVSRLRDRVGDVQVVLEPVTEVARTASGKVRSVICNLDQAREAV